MTGGFGSPCGACKFLRRKCVNGCVFAPYFSNEQGPTVFAAIHKVFGASNVSKLLAHLPVRDRSEAAVTISYEAQARLRDPVYGCVSHIFALQQQVVNLQAQLSSLIKAQAITPQNLIVNGSSSSTSSSSDHQEDNFYGKILPSYNSSSSSSSSSQDDHIIQAAGLFDHLQQDDDQSRILLEQQYDEFHGIPTNDIDAETMSMLYYENGIFMNQLNLMAGVDSTHHDHSAAIMPEENGNGSFTSFELDSSHDVIAASSDIMQITDTKSKWGGLQNIDDLQSMAFAYAQQYL